MLFLERSSVAILGEVPSVNRRDGDSAVGGGAAGTSDVGRQSSPRSRNAANIPARTFSRLSPLGINPSRYQLECPREGDLGQATGDADSGRIDELFRFFANVAA